MPPTSSRTRFPGHVVTAVVVSHDGARWLPDCLSGLAGQFRPPQHVVAVDTGSSDDSVRLLVAALGEPAVVRLARDAALGAAVQAGLDAVDAGSEAAGQPTRWVWVLHDDCVAEADALDRLLTRAADSPSAVVIGPKTLGWDGRHLLEVGVTIDSSGCRQTGLDPGEPDQGQHDDLDDVLAVGTAGMLVRRDVWDRLGGLDGRWPLFGEDVDFGWRVRACGKRVIVAPQAVVRHAAALAAGTRSADAVPGRVGVAVRRHGMQVVLANTSSPLVAALVARYLVEGALRALGTLALRRRPHAAADELVAALQVVLRPRVVAAARRRRRAPRTVAHRALRPLLAAPALRWRRLADDLARVFARGERGEPRRRPARVPVATGPVADDAEPLPVDHAGSLRRVASRPGVALAVALGVVALVADRGVLGGALHGGRLLPAPGGAGDLWSAYAQSWHPVGLGSSAVAPVWVAVVAVSSSLLLGKVWLVVDVLMLGALPLAGLTAYLAARGLTTSKALRVLAAVTYALLPALTGALATGRLDVVATVVLLPLAGRAVAAAMTVSAAGWGWHRCFGAGLVLAVAVAFAPYLWVLTAATLVVVVGVVRGDPAHRREAGRCGRAASVTLAVAALVLLPWSAAVLAHPSMLLTGVGLPDGFASRTPQPVAHLLLLHPDGPGQPGLWVLAPGVLAALVGLARGIDRPVARFGVVIYLVGTAGALAQSRVSGLTPGVAESRSWTGAALAFAGVGALLAAVAAGDGARAALRHHSFGWRQPVAVALLAAATAGVVTSAASWLARGAARPLSAAASSAIPLFAAAEAGRPTAPRLLALRAAGPVVHYALLRRPTGPRLADPDLAPPAASGDAAARRLAAVVREVAAGRAGAAASLAQFGVGVIVVASPAGAALARLDDADGLARVPSAGSVVYRLTAPAGELALVPAVAARGDPPSAGAGSALLPASDAGTTSTRLRSGPPGRILVLAERFDPHWRARLDGRMLRPVRAYGWAQGWVLPRAAGRLVVDRTGERRGGWLTAQLVAVVIAGLLAVPAPGRGGLPEAPR